MDDAQKQAKKAMPQLITAALLNQNNKEIPIYLINMSFCVLAWPAVSALTRYIPLT